MRHALDIIDQEPVETEALPHLGAAERALVYRWLAGLFAHEPTVDSLEVYQSDDGAALLMALSEVDALAPVTEMMQFWVANSDRDDLRIIALDLAGEFAQLFLGVGGRRSAPPYQSFYSSPENRLMQQSAAEMQDALRACEARIADRFPEPPDHIAVQLTLMADLAASMTPAEQTTFLEQHIRNWVGEFRERCAVASHYGFYTCAATAVVNFVEADAAILNQGARTTVPA